MRCRLIIRILVLRPQENEGQDRRSSKGRLGRHAKGEGKKKRGGGGPWREFLVKEGFPKGKLEGEFRRSSGRGIRVERGGGQEKPCF